MSLNPQINSRLNELGIEFLAGYFLGVGLFQTPYVKDAHQPMYYQV